MDIQAMPGFKGRYAWVVRISPENLLSEGKPRYRSNNRGRYLPTIDQLFETLVDEDSMNGLSTVGKQCGKGQYPDCLPPVRFRRQFLRALKLAGHHATLRWSAGSTVVSRKFEKTSRLQRIAP